MGLRRACRLARPRRRRLAPPRLDGRAAPLPLSSAHFVTAQASLCSEMSSAGRLPPPASSIQLDCNGPPPLKLQGPGAPYTSPAGMLAAVALALRRSEATVRGQLLRCRSLPVLATAASPPALFGTLSPSSHDMVAPVPCSRSHADDDEGGDVDALVQAPAAGRELGCFTSRPEPPNVAAADMMGDADHEEAPWLLVQPRRGVCRGDFAPPAFGARPSPPVWLHGRCHRCHEEGHWAYMCTEQLRCNNCRHFGHKAKGCTAPTAPRPPPVQAGRRQPPPPHHQPARSQAAPVPVAALGVAASRPVDVHVAISATSKMHHEVALRRAAQSPTTAKEATLPPQFALAEEAELIRYELQRCLARVDGFLARAEAALGRLPVVPVVAPMSEAHVVPMSSREADFYGCLSPRGRLCTLPLPDVPSESEAIVGVVAPVLQVMTELQEMCGESASAISMVDSLDASVVSLPPAPPFVGPSQMLTIVEREEREGVDDVGIQSTASYGHVASVDGEVVASSTLSTALASVPGALFAKKLCDFLVRLEADDPGSGKTIGCLLKEREMRNKSKKVGSGIVKEKSFKSKIKKSGASRKACAAA